jgi:hypothetical protein
MFVTRSTGRYTLAVATVNLRQAYQHNLHLTSVTNFSHRWEISAKTQYTHHLVAMTRLSGRANVSHPIFLDQKIQRQITTTSDIQGGSNMTGTDLCVNKSQFVPVIFEPPCSSYMPTGCHYLSLYSRAHECICPILAHFTITRKCKWLFVKGYGSNSPIPTTKEFLTHIKKRQVLKRLLSI